MGVTEKRINRKGKSGEERRQQQKTMRRILERQKVDGEVNRAESKEH